MDLTQSPTKRRTNIAVADVNADRISQLTDELLILIFSFLSTKEAVQTSLLAKRFQNLWAAVPVLDFDFDEFHKDDLEEDEDEKDISDIHENFKKFVNGVLEHRNRIINLDSFKLELVEEGINPELATTWLDNVATDFKLKFLSVHISTGGHAFRVPGSMFSCESLQVMELHLRGEPIRPTSLNLPCLKKLTLVAVEIIDDVMQKLLGLPSLEEMVLTWCNLKACNISSATLKRLVLDKSVIRPDISISTLNLLYLKIHPWLMKKIKLKELESLVKVCIHYRKLDNKVRLFLMGLSNVTCLELMLSSKLGCLQIKDVLEEETIKLPTFNNLKSLKIGGWCMTDEFDLVACFLLHASNLEKLTLFHCPWQSHYKVEICLGFAVNEFRIMEVKGINFNMNETEGMEKDKINDDIKELVKRVYNTLLGIRPEMNIISCSVIINEHFTLFPL